MPRLLVNPGTPQQWEIHLKPGQGTLGRSAACDYQIEHASISGTHAQVTVQDGTVIIKDLGSTNGTFLDKGPVQEAALTPGRRLQLGGVEMELVLDPPRVAVAAPETGPAPAPPPAPRVALRVSAHAPAIPPPPDPPAAETDAAAPSAAPSAPAKCKYHPKALAHWHCGSCHLSYCDLCVTSRSGGVGTGRFCRRCSQECAGLDVSLLPSANPHANFFAAIPRAFAYPFKGTGLFFLIYGALFASLPF